MNKRYHNPPPRQETLLLEEAERPVALPRQVRDRCRELVAQMLVDLVQKQEGGDDDER